MKIPKEAVDFLKHSLNIDLRVRKFYELFENLHDLDKKYPFPAKGSLEEALFREKQREEVKMGNSVETIKDFLEWRGPKGEKPEEYDFKRNMYGYYQRYEENVKKKLGDQAYKEFMDGMPYGIEEKSCIEEWLSYKTADAKWIEDKRFDCDNSNTTCILTRLIYVLLWNWGAKNKDKPSQPLMAFNNKEFGGDTMNSLATTFNEYMRTVANNAMFTKKIAKMFLKTGVEFWQEEIGEEFWERWNKFARNTQCIGNFVLVPYYFNGGRCGKTKDYWDLSLDLLRNNDGENMGLIADEKRQINWSKKDFNRYINLFFLWDYVKCEDLDVNGSPKPRWLFDRKRKESILPQEQIDFQNFLDNVNKWIERRSQFMVAMLKIASGMSSDGKSEYEYCGKYQSEWKEWTVSGIYKEFMERIFMKDEIYAGYGEVIDRMKEVVDEIVQKDLDRKWIGSIMDDLSDLRNAVHHGVGGEDLEKIVYDCLEMDSDLLYNNCKEESPPLLDIPDYIWPQYGLRDDAE